MDEHQREAAFRRLREEIHPDFFEKGEPHDATGLVRRLGIPNGAEWVHIISLGPIHLTQDDVILAVERPLIGEFLPFAPKSLRGWDGYYLRLTGCLIPRLNEAREYPQVQVQTSAGNMNIQIWRLRAFRLKDHAYAEIAWHPAWGDVRKTIRLTEGWEALTPTQQDAAILGAAGGLRAIEGIVKGTGGPTAMSDDDALEEAVRLGGEWLDDHPDKAISDLKSKHLAERKVVAPKSYDAWMTEKHFGIKKVRTRLRGIRGEK